MSERKKLEFDEYRISEKKILNKDTPYFKIEGCHQTFKFMKYYEQGAKKWIDAFGDHGWRSFYVGKRPYERNGLKIRPVVIKLVKKKK